MKKLPTYINIEEFEKLFEAVNKLKRITPRRKKEYKLAMLLGFEAGMRISEIVGYLDKVPILSKEQVDLQRHTIRIVSGKGEKDRVVPLPKRFNLTAYNMLPLKIDRRALQFFITKLGGKVLNKKITFHTLRHSFASNCVNKMPLHQLQMLLGHSRLDTTGIYLHANPDEAIRNARECF